MGVGLALINTLKGWDGEMLQKDLPGSLAGSPVAWRRQFWLSLSVYLSFFQRAFTFSFAICHLILWVTEGALFGRWGLGTQRGKMISRVTHT